MRCYWSKMPNIDRIQDKRPFSQSLCTQFPVSNNLEFNNHPYVYKLIDMLIFSFFLESGATTILRANCAGLNVYSIATRSSSLDASCQQFNCNDPKCHISTWCTRCYDHRAPTSLDIYAWSTTSFNTRSKR